MIESMYGFKGENGDRNIFKRTRYGNNIVNRINNNCSIHIQDCTIKDTTVYGVPALVV
jgi:hypothetical protein